MQLAPPGILGICVRTSATVPPISVTESMAVESMLKVKKLRSGEQFLNVFFS